MATIDHPPDSPQKTSVFEKIAGRHQREFRELLCVVIDLGASITTLAVSKVLESESLSNSDSKAIC